MKPLTYRQLLVALQELPDESLDMNVCILNLIGRTINHAWETILASELPDKVRESCSDLSEEQPVITIDS